MPRILIIDDSPTDVHVFSKLLENNGYEVDSASDADEGINKAVSTTPDLVLMDVIMPGMNGFQATRHLSKNPATSNIPIIIVSTKNMETDKLWGLRQGAFDYLTKPISDSVLLNKIKQALES